MATGGGDSERPPDDLDLRHFCSLCMEPYRGRIPKILPCFHTFCLPCLTTMQASGPMKTTESLKDKAVGQTDDVEVDVKCGNDAAVTPDGVFSCPTCRAQIPIPDGGMAKLQNNFYLDDDGRGQSTSPSVRLCDMCDVTNQQEVTHECRTCSRSMCSGCRRYHDKLMPDHNVTPLSVSTGKPSGRERNTPRNNNYCLIHPDQRLCFYCRQCDVIICMHCKMTSHEGHVTVDMARDISEYREEMTSLLTTAREQLQVSERALRRLDRDDRELTRYTQKMTQKVHARHDALMTWVLQSRDQLLDDVIAKEEEVRGQLRGEKTAVSITMETLTSLVSRAARVTSNDPDALLLKKEIQAALHGEDRLSHLRKLADRHESAFCWLYDVTDADVLPPELVAAYMGRVVEGTADDVMRMTPLSLREVSDRVDRWITDVTETTAMLKKADDDLQAQTTSLDNEVTAMKKVDADLQAKTTSLDNDVTAMKKVDADLQAKSTSLDNDVTAMKKVEANLQAKSTSLENAQKKTEADLQAKTTSLGNDVTSLEETVDDLQAKTTSLDDDVTAMKQTQADLQTDVMSLGRTAKSFSNKFDNMGNLFFAVDPDWDETKHCQAIIYQQATQKYNCFDAETSTFTAPQDGLYTFCVHIETHKTKYNPTAHLMVNNSSRSTFKGDYNGKKFREVVFLSQGDTVWLKAGSHGHTFHDTCSFSGYFACSHSFV